MSSLSPPEPQPILERASAPCGSALPLPRLLLVFAHPDDETLAMGARLERLAASKLLTLTDGTPRDGADARHHGFASLEAYRAARRDELCCALDDAHLSSCFVLSSRGTPLPDQTAAFHLAALTPAIEGAITALQPEAVLTHPYEGGHPDHDACAFAVHSAVERLAKHHAAAATQAQTPLILEAPFYHAGEHASMRTGAFLEMPNAPETITRALSPEEQRNKQRRLACFRSQRETLAQFGTRQELFRIAPRYDFTQPPHPGQLLYERFPWGMSGQRFCELAVAAEATLSTPESA